MGAKQDTGVEGLKCTECRCEFVIASQVTSGYQEMTVESWNGHCLRDLIRATFTHSFMFGKILLRDVRKSEFIMERNYTHTKSLSPLFTNRSHCGDNSNSRVPKIEWTVPQFCMLTTASLFNNNIVTAAVFARSLIIKSNTPFHLKTFWHKIDVCFAKQEIHWSGETCTVKAYSHQRQLIRPRIEQTIWCEFIHKNQFSGSWMNWGTNWNLGVDTPTGIVHWFNSWTNSSIRLVNSSVNSFVVWIGLYWLMVKQIAVVFQPNLSLQ